VWWVIGILTISAAAVWLMRRSGTRGADPADRDHDVLGEAEREVRDLPSMTGPDDAADALPDWGPGAPKP
jgi:hypothetical protein